MFTEAMVRAVDCTKIEMKNFVMKVNQIVPSIALLK
jgi:hypothetical protein